LQHMWLERLSTASESVDPSEWFSLIAYTALSSHCNPYARPPPIHYSHTDRTLVASGSFDAPCSHKRGEGRLVDSGRLVAEEEGWMCVFQSVRAVPVCGWMMQSTGGKLARSTDHFDLRD
jgi:hypothetical protein